MRILILGGTRFLGKRIAELLSLDGHELTIISRSTDVLPFPVVQRLYTEREEGIAALKGRHFDIAIDFICYKTKDIDSLFANVLVQRYVMISSTWVPHLWFGRRADEIKSDVSMDANFILSNLTKNYLKGKLGAELALEKRRKEGHVGVTLRLPIIFSEDDHTKRLDFYCSRLTDGWPLILVDSADNKVQIAEKNDLASAIVFWINHTDLGKFTLWEALPGEGVQLRKLIKLIKEKNNLSTQLINVSKDELESEFPEYLDAEPLWKETPLAVSSANIYGYLGLKPSTFGEDLDLTKKYYPSSPLRSMELAFLDNRYFN